MSHLYKWIFFLIISLALLLMVIGCSEDNDGVVYSPDDNDGVVYAPDDYSAADLDEAVQNNVIDEDVYLDEAVYFVDTNSDIDDVFETANPSFNVLENFDIDEDGVLVISEADFPVQIQAIQFNRSHFLGLTIRYEGLLLSTDWGDDTIYFVARLEGGCCGFYGFEVYLNDIPPFENETWVEVTGIFEEFYVEGDDRTFFRLNVISLYEV